MGFRETVNFATEILIRTREYSKGALLDPRTLARTGHNNNLRKI
jgi:hypothetical protein